MINKSRLVFRFRGRNTVATVPSCLVFLFYSSCVCVCVCVVAAVPSRPVFLFFGSCVCVLSRPPPPRGLVPQLVRCVCVCVCACVCVFAFVFVFILPSSLLEIIIIIQCVCVQCVCVVDCCVYNYLHPIGPSTFML